MKKNFSVILVFILMVSMLSTICYASNGISLTSYKELRAMCEYDAMYLYNLGLLKGVSSRELDFGYDLIANRNEAITMIVRISGCEREALSGNYNSPFKDIDNWAKPYISYAYENGITRGTSETTFSGHSPITKEEFVTLVLRTLGYKDGEDFYWRESLALSDKLGITDKYMPYPGNFKRNSMIAICGRAIDTTVKGENYDLGDFVLDTDSDCTYTKRYIHMCTKSARTYNNLNIIESMYDTIGVIPERIFEILWKDGVRITYKRITDDWPELFGACGAYSYSDKLIYINVVFYDTLIHEIGHAISYMHSYYLWPNTGENLVVKARDADLKLGTAKEVMNEYAYTNIREYFAEAFEAYYCNRQNLMKFAPNTYELIRSTLKLCTI